MKDIKRTIRKENNPTQNTSLINRVGSVHNKVLIDVILPEVTPGDLIPHVIYQTWSTKKLPIGMAAAVQTLKDANPEFEHRLFDDADCRNFIKENFPAQILYAYDSLIPGAYKADLWRYCVLYINGGVYLDIKFIPQNGFKFISIIKQEHLCKDRPTFYTNRNGIYNALMILKSGNSYIGKAIKQIHNNCISKNYTHSMLYVTGPGLLGTIVPQNYLVGSNYLGDDKIQMGYKIILQGYPTYRFDQHNSGKLHYHDSWLKKKVYNYIDNSKYISKHTAIYMWNIKPDEKNAVPLLNINANAKYQTAKVIGPADILPLVANYPGLQTVWDTIPHWVTKADVGRLVYVYYNGGFYFDIDCKINNEIYFKNKMVLFKENIVNVNTLGPRESKNALRIANYAFGTDIIEHPFLKEVIDECIRRLTYLRELKLETVLASDILWSGGPDVITSIYHLSKHKYADIILLDTSYVEHKCYGSWR